MKYVLFYLSFLLCAVTAKANNGEHLWLDCHWSANPCQVVGSLKASPTIGIAAEELRQHWTLGPQVRLSLRSMLQLGEGYHITVRQIDSSKCPQLKATIVASSAAGLLYGAYQLLRLQNTGGLDSLLTSAPKDHGQSLFVMTEQPVWKLRMLNHWDNLDGSVERGYAGNSIWKWEQILGHELTPQLRRRLTIYARANASIGINAIVLNNVNASPLILTRPYLEKVQAIAQLLRPYHIKVYLSVNFGTPKALGATSTADPLCPDVAMWWQRKAKEIYALIPDFGGFLVKANSEGQPGPGDYGRSHADGANMLANALKPFGGSVIWRSFVYGAHHKGEDRVKQAVSEFEPMDGLMADNVILQSKNGPLDFQPREPFAPIFYRMHHTPQMGELQITQEYLGQSKHLVYLAPMWKEFLSYVRPSMLVGIAGVANTGDTDNWCGHPFSQANWYAFGRLAWNPQLSAENIALEWSRQTFKLPTEQEQQLCHVMLSSHETCTDYMMPLGLHHIFRFDHHYGPEPGGFNPKYPLEWCPTYYHRADTLGLGFDRTVATGSGATAQYPPHYAALYEQLDSCPERYLLWFHHVAWTHRMLSGRTLWQELCHHYNSGVAQVAQYRSWWHNDMHPYIDNMRWQQVDTLLTHQLANAQEWRDSCLNYFSRFARQPIIRPSTHTIRQ